MPRKSALPNVAFYVVTKVLNADQHYSRLRAVAELWLSTCQVLIGELGNIVIPKSVDNADCEQLRRVRFRLSMTEPGGSGIQPSNFTGR